MLCSSPISAYTPLYILSSLFSSAGISSPDCIISVRRPTVLSATVLPPVFGPVISMASRSDRNTVMGTTRSFGISGCLAESREILPDSFKSGRTAF